MGYVWNNATSTNLSHNINRIWNQGTGKGKKEMRSEGGRKEKREKRRGEETKINHRWEKKITSIKPEILISSIYGREV